MATIKLTPNTYAVSSTSYLSVSDASNMYTDTSSTTYATITNTNASTSSRYLYLRGFNFGSIPSGAIVNSFTIKIRGRESGLSTNTSYAPRLANGTSALSNTTASSTFGTSASTITIPTGALTWDQIVDYGNNFTIMVYVRRSNKNTTGYFYCYGAEIEVNYTAGVYYNVTASSAVTGITLTPATQSILEGNDAEDIVIPVSDISNYVLKDNNIDVTSQAVRVSNGVDGSLSKYPESESHSGISNGSSYAAYCIGHSAESPYNSTNNMYASSGSTGYAEYTFDFSDIPANATINDVSITVNGHRENSSITSDRISRVQAYSGSTAKGEYYEFTSTSNQTHTLEDIGTWTRAELQNAKLRHTVGYYGGLVCGVTWTVEYEVAGSGYHYIYSISNVTTNHAVSLEESGPYIPPEEDPTYTYWPITISSINATTNPPTGTTRVIEGTNQTITITPSDPQLTLALDNGVDITSQLVGGVPSNTYTVTTTAPNASYGFNLNSSTGYYVSTNGGVNKSASVARLNLDLESDCLVTLSYINYAEASYDYGMFGKLDTTVATDGLTAGSSSSYPSDSTSNYQLAMCSNSSSVQTITYSVPIGQHFIDIKYGKDDASNANNDSLQWKVTSIEATSAGGDYTYTLTNINQKHSLIFVFGNVNFYYITSSSTSGARIFPDGQSVVLEGDNYSLNIVPDSVGSTVTITDNNVNMTPNLSREDGFDRNGNPIVSYKYQLLNIQAAHTLVIQVGEATMQLYVKVGTTWTPYTTVYKKINGSWVVQSDITTVFNTNINYRKGN